MSGDFGLPAPGSGRFAAALGVALLWNLAAGEPPAPLSVRVWMGLATRGLRRLARGAAPIALAVPAVFAGAAWCALDWLEPERPWLAFALTTWWLAGSIALVGLGRGSLGVLEALRAGTLPDARARLAAFAGSQGPPRERDDLVAATAGALARRTGAEFCAPLLAYALFGLPGALVDAGLRAAREAAGPRSARATGPSGGPDSHAEPRSLAERVHELWSFAPARLTALVLLVAARLLGEDAARGLRASVRAHERPSSHAADVPAAALVGALGLALDGGGGPASATELERPTRPPSAERVRVAWRVACLAAAVWSALAALTLWGAGGPLSELLRR